MVYGVCLLEVEDDLIKCSSRPVKCGKAFHVSALRGAEDDRSFCQAHLWHRARLDEVWRWELQMGEEEDSCTVSSFCARDLESEGCRCRCIVAR